jgi:hypothetical protein
VLKPVLRLQSAWIQRLKLEYDEPLSNFAFDFKLCRYIAANLSGLRTASTTEPGRAVQVASIKPSFLELNATRLINLDRANNVWSHGTAVQVGSIKTRVESASRISA